MENEEKSSILWCVLVVLYQLAKWIFIIGAAIVCFICSLMFDLMKKNK